MHRNRTVPCILCIKTEHTETDLRTKNEHSKRKRTSEKIIKYEKRKKMPVESVFFFFYAFFDFGTEIAIIESDRSTVTK